MALSYDTIFAYICGVYSGNYDITHMFIDSLYKLTGEDDDAKAVEFLDKLDRFSEATGLKFTIMISADDATAPEGIKKFF